jgi:hypothetical protein
MKLMEATSWTGTGNGEVARVREASLHEPGKCLLQFRCTRNFDLFQFPYVSQQAVVRMTFTIYFCSLIFHSELLLLTSRGAARELIIARSRDRPHLHEFVTLHARLA